MARGIKVAGVNIFKLLRSLMETGAVAASVKDPVWKYKWVEKNEPAVFGRNFAVFKRLHRDNRKNFAALNKG